MTVQQLLEEVVARKFAHKAALVALEDVYEQLDALSRGMDDPEGSLSYLRYKVRDSIAETAKQVYADAVSKLEHIIQEGNAH